MISIYRDSHTIQVTKGAYKQIYKPLGWMVVEEESNRQEDVLDDKSINTQEDNRNEGEAINFELEEGIESDEDLNKEDDAELLEKPLSSMSLKELYRYAELSEIELEQGLTKALAKEAIKNAL